MVTCVKPAEYDAIAGSLVQTLTYDTLQPFLQEHAVSRFTGEAGGDVVISNASESSTAAVNTLLRSGKQVGMITEGEYKGDFICSYEDWQAVSADHILTGTGVKDPDITAYVIEKTPTVCISGTKSALRPASEGYIYSTLETSTDYNNDRIAMELMGFDTTEDPAGADYFTALPKGAKVLVQRDGSRAPLEGIFYGKDEKTKDFLNGIMGFSYEGKDNDGNDVNITLFAAFLTETRY